MFVLLILVELLTITFHNNITKDRTTGIPPQKLGDQLILKGLHKTGMNTVNLNTSIWGRRGRDRMVVGFTTTYAINALSALIFCFVFCFFQGEVYNIM